MTIEEILALEDISTKIYQLKQYRKTQLPDKDRLLADWDPYRHDVMDEEKRPDEIKVVVPEEKDPITGKVTKMAVTKKDPVNRIAMPLEQDIVNIHTAFTVGIEPNVTCETEDKKENELFKVIKLIDRKNKTKYLNKRVVRSWLSEQEVAEYWYTVEDKSFWKMIINKIKGVLGKETASRKLKCAIWSPFKGDKLYPFFNETGDYKALSREYQVRVSSTQLDTYFMTVTDTAVYTWKQNSSAWEVVPSGTFAHNFKKNPTVYSYRPTALCENIRPIRNRLETVLSNYSDCLDYNFAPKLVARGKVIGNQPKGARGGLVEIENDGDLKYLSWQQSPEAAKLEIDTLTQNAYALTNTPRLTFSDLHGLGSAPSGTAFKFFFMGIHLAVENHAEVIGEHLQRRYNFLASAVGSINTAYEEASQTIDIDVSIIPYTIDSLAENVKLAMEANGGNPVIDQKGGIVLAGLVEADKADETLALIEQEDAKRKEESAYPNAGL